MITILGICMDYYSVARYSSFPHLANDEDDGRHDELQI